MLILKRDNYLKIIFLLNYMADYYLLKTQFSAS